MSGKYDRAFYAWQTQGSVDSAETVVPVLMRLFSPASVVDFGCGQGGWLAAFKAAGATQILGIDGDYVDRNALKIPIESFRAADLSRAIDLGARFDLAISLEVAEHLPPAAAEQFVRSIARAAPAIVFSAAIPFQRGVGHVNGQWQDYWASLFEAIGFVPVDIRGLFWNDRRVEVWYRQNMLLYVDRELLARSPQLQKLAESTVRTMLSCVHPEYYERFADAQRIDLGHIGLKRLMRGMPALISNSVSYRLKEFFGRGR